MTYDLDELLRLAAPEPGADVDVDAVIARGRRLSRRRTMAGVASAAVGLAAVVVLVQSVAGDQFAPSLEPVDERPSASVEGSAGPGPAMVVDVDSLSEETGTVVATVDDLDERDLVALGPDGAIGVLTRAELRIELDDRVTARVDIASALAEVVDESESATEPPTDVEQLADRPRSLTFDLDGHLWAYIATDDGVWVELEPSGGATVTPRPPVLPPLMAALDDAIETEVIAGRSRAATLVADGDTTDDVQLHIGEFSAPDDDQPRPPDRLVTVLAGLVGNADADGLDVHAVTLPDGFADAPSWDSGTPGSLVHSGAAVGYIPRANTAGSDRLVIRGRDAAMDVDLVGGSVRVDGTSPLPGLLHVPGTGLVRGPTGAITGTWILDIDTFDDRVLLLLAPELGQDGTDLVIPVDESLWADSERQTGPVRPLVSPDGAVGITVERADGTRSVRRLDQSRP